MNRREEEFLALYRDRRFDDQRRWYDARSREYRAAHDQVITTTGVTLFGASAAGLAAAADIGDFRIGWAVIAAVMAALGTLVDAYGQLLGYEQNAKIYDDARAALAEAHVRAPWLDGNDRSTGSAEAFVADVEAVLQRELGQWGQLPPPQADRAPPPEADTAPPTRTNPPPSE